MMYKFNDRLLNIHIPNMADDLLLTHFLGREYLSYPFCFHLTVLSKNTEIPLEKLLQQPVNIKIQRADQAPHFYHGLIVAAKKAALDPDGFQTYQLTIEPWLQFLTHTRDCRIFGVEKPLSIPDIISTLLKKYPNAHYDLSRLTKTYPALSYCVQYNESDFNFIHRLLEQAGIYYYFTHTSQQHMMVLEDSGQKFSQNIQTLHYSTEDSTKPHITNWSALTAFQPHTSETVLYQFNQPSRLYHSQQTQSSPFDNISTQQPFSYFHYGDLPRYPDSTYVDEYEKLQLNALQNQTTKIQASSQYVNLSPGTGFQLNHHDDPSQIGTYYIYAITHDIRDTSHRGYHKQNEAPAQQYHNRFHAYHIDQIFLPGARYQESDQDFTILPIQRPHIHNIQTATVVGPAGKSIYTDQYGRVKLQFHWDRYGKSDENSSCWVRVLHPWAGKDYKTQFIPRVGQEIIVDFDHGDPNRPFVLGGVPNPANMQPFYPGSHPTQLGFQSRTLGAKDPQKGNVLRFDDHSKQEEIYLKASKDLISQVGQHSKKEVDQSSHTTIQKGNYISQVGGVLTVNAKKEIRLTCQDSAIIIGPQNITIQGKQISFDKSSTSISGSSKNASASLLWAQMLDKLPSQNPITKVKTLNTKPLHYLKIQICDRYNEKQPTKDAHLASLIKNISAKIEYVVTGNFGFTSIDDVSNFDVAAENQFLIFSFDPNKIEKVHISLNALDDHDDKQALYIIGKNAKPRTDPVDYQIMLTSKDWKQSPKKDSKGNIIHTASLTVLEPLTLYNFRHDGNPHLPPDAQINFNAVASYMGNEAGGPAPIQPKLDPWMLNHFKDNGNNVTFFIHGYNVGLGELPSCFELNLNSSLPVPNSLRCTIHRDNDYLQTKFPDTTTDDFKTTPSALYGNGAHGWLLNLEYNLNKAAGFDGKNYSKYTRLIGIAWQGNPQKPTDYMAATPLTHYPAKQTFELIKAFYYAGVKINIIAHSLGNDVLMNLLSLCGQNNIKIEHAFLWEAAIPWDSFERQQKNFFPMIINQTNLPYEYKYPKAVDGAETFTVLYSNHDGILGSLPHKAQKTSLDWSAQLIHDFYYGLLDTKEKFLTNFMYYLLLIKPQPYPLPLQHNTPNASKLLSAVYSGIYEGSDSSERIKILKEKTNDPSAGIMFAAITELIFILDAYALPAANIHKPLISIYHVANLFVYPLGYFFDNTSAHCTTYYQAWKKQYQTFTAVIQKHMTLKNKQYHSTLPLSTASQITTIKPNQKSVVLRPNTPFKDTLAEQQKFLRQNMPLAFNFISAGAYLAKHFMTTASGYIHALSWFLSSDNEINKWIDSGDGNFYFDAPDANKIATILLTGLLTDQAAPKPALGYQGAEKPFSGYKRVDQGDKLADHSAMLFPDKAMRDKIYKGNLLHGTKGQQFTHFGKWL